MATDETKEIENRIDELEANADKALTAAEEMAKAKKAKK